MTKRILMTSALISAMALSQAYAASETPALAAPKLTISGQSNFNAWWFHNDRTVIVPATPFGPGEPCDYIGKGRGYLFTVDDARLKFDITGKTDPGMDYGFTIVVDADTNKQKNIKENYLYFGGSWGKLTMGDVDGVEDTMAFYGGDPLGGTGGFDGNFDRVVNFTTGTVVSPDLVGDTSRSTKIIYHTPRWKGLQAGVSYTPRTQHRGEAATDTLRGKEGDIGTNRKIFDTHSFAGGVNFINKFNNGWELALSGTFIFGEAHSPCKNIGPSNSQIVTTQGLFLAPGNFSFTNKFKNTSAFALGFLNSYKGFEWGGEFGWNGRSHEATRVSYQNANAVTSTAKAKDSWFIDTGLAYNWGATKLSGGYFYGHRKAVAYNAVADNIGNSTSRTHIFTTALDHKLAPGVLVFGEYAHYNMKNNGAPIDGAIANAANNPGTQYFEVRSGKSNAFVLGTKIKF